MSAFEELGVMPELINALEDMQWHLPTPVQTEAVPLILGGGDVAIAAETGAGKTGAFCLPVLQVVYETRNTNLAAAFSAPLDDTVLAGPIRLSSADRGRQVAVNPEGTIAQCRHPAIWQGVRATHGVASGKWYFLARPQDDGICRVGWSSAHAQLNLGTDQRGFGYGGTGMKSYDGKFDRFGKTYGNGDEICCMICFTSDDDIEKSTVSVSYMRNDEAMGEAFSISFMELGVENLCLLPTAAFKNAQIEFDFGARCPKAEKLGFRSISQATIADSEIPDNIRKAFEEQQAEEADIVMKDADHSVKRVGEKGKQPVVLILEPSRELAGQVEEEINKMGKHFPPNALRHLLLAGGGNAKKEKAAFKRGLDIVTGTLGSVVRHVKNRNFSMDSIRFFILDEADTFATDNMGDILFLHEKVPMRNRVQTLLFSATLHSPEIKGLSEKIQSFPIWVDLKGKEAVPDTLHHTLVRVDADSDTALLNGASDGIEWPLDDVHITGQSNTSKNKKAKSAGAFSRNVNMEDAADVRSQTIKKLKLVVLKKVIDANNMTQAMLFVRTQRDADNVESFLLQCSGVVPEAISSRRFRGRRDTGPEVEYSCSVLHGGRRQEERKQALAAFKAGEVRFLVCTDVAARGLDVVGLPFLVNVTLPDKPENYIHRVGRVGRAERLGLAVSLVSAQKEAVWYHICKKARQGVCNNRKLVTAGGCVMWYNESKLLGEIEERLKGQIEELGSDFRRKDSTMGLQLYGSRIGEEDMSVETAKHIEALQPDVRKLIKMEEDAQMLYFGLQETYACPVVK